MTHATVDATLRVAGIDLDSAETAEILATHFPNLLWEIHENVVSATFSAPADDVIAHVVNAARRLETHLHGVEVEGVVRDWVTITDIANRIGVSREAVRKWSARDDFPVPEALVGGDSQKIWAWTVVVDWIQNVRGIQLEERLLTLKQMTQLENCLMRNPDHTTVQWHKSQSAPAFRTVHPSASRRVVVDAATGRGRSATVKDRRVPVAAGAIRG